jgi:DNA-binding NtrC family response regulator
MSEFLTANITYLDDQHQYLNEAVKLFQDLGITIQTTDSIIEAKHNVFNKQTDILLCDLRLEEIGLYLRGNNILRLIRTKRKDIFLALYTAYKNELSKAELNILSENQIFVYEKDDIVEFMFNLKKDYTRFKENLSGSSSTLKQSFDTNISESIVSKVIHHLNNIKNKDLLVPVPGFEDIKVSNLIVEVFNKSEIAEKYIEIWVQTKLMIETYKKNK